MVYIVHLYYIYIQDFYNFVNFPKDSTKLGLMGSPAIISKYSKTCLKRPLKIDKTMVLMENGSLMEVESIAECSP